MALETVLFSLTLRLYFERIVIISSIISFLWIAVVSAGVVFAHFFPLPAWIVLYVSITLHHLICLLGPLRFFYGFFDFIFLVIEIIGVSWYAITGIPTVKSWAPELLTLHALFVWLTLGGLVPLFVFRLATIIRNRGKALIAPYNVFSDQRSSDQKPNFFHMCMGRSIWMAKFVGETEVVILLRGLLGLVLLITMVVWMLKSIIFEPMKETALSPVREFRSMGLPSDFVDDIEPPAWNIVIPFLNTSIMSLDAFAKVMTVTANWNGFIGPPCTLNATFVREYNYAFYHFICQSMRIGASNVLPNLNIVIHSFSPLIGGVRPISDEIYEQDYLPILIGMTNSTESIKYITQTTTPLAMLSGVSVVTSIVPAIRQIFTHRGLASLGLFQLSTTFWDPRIVGMYHDPAWDSTGTDESSLRIIYQADMSGIRIIQDYRQNSVVSGFASVGGLWAALSGIFTLIFGASMFHIIYGVKPLSIFGMAHSFQYQHMKEETLRLYPNILREHMALENRGLLALLRDHLIDLSFLEKEQLEKQKLKNDVEQLQTEKENDLEVSRLLVRAPTKSGDEEEYQAVSFSG